MTMNMLRGLTLNKGLGLAVALLGLLAVVVGSPYGGTRVALDARELAGVVQREVDHVSPSELADWIIQGKMDYRLMDLRSEAEFSRYHIPSAENVTLTQLADHGLRRNEKIVLYSEGGIHSAQAWFLLRAKGYHGVYILRGGLEEWKDQVLFPRLPDNSDPAQKAAFEKMKEVSRFFGGSPQTGPAGEPQSVAPPLPSIEAPTTVLPPAAAGKKKKEGC